MRRTCALALLFFLAGCRQVDELRPPAAPGAAARPSAAEARPPGWLSSEASVFEHVQKVYEDAGFPEVRTAVLRVSEDVPLPSYSQLNRTLFVPPFSDGLDKVRARIAHMSATHFSGAFTFLDAFDSGSEALTAYRVLLAVAVAHELWHHVQLRGKPGELPAPADVYDLECEAIEAEQAFLAHEIDSRQFPASFREHYRRAVLAIRDSVPEAVITSLPEDDKQLRTIFAQAYLTYGRGELSAGDGVNVEVSAGQLVYAGYTRKRLTLLAKGGRSLEALAKADSAKAEAQKKKPAP
jgi:hypothetical protein